MCLELCCNPISAELGLFYGPCERFFQHGRYMDGCLEVWILVIGFGSPSGLFGGERL